MSTDPRWAADTELRLAKRLYAWADGVATDDGVPGHVLPGWDEDEQEARDACLHGAREFLAELADAGVLAAPLPHVTEIHPPDSAGHYSWSCTRPGCPEDASGYDDRDEVIEAATAHGPLAAGSYMPPKVWCVETVYPLGEQPMVCGEELPCARHGVQAEVEQ